MLIQKPLTNGDIVTLKLTNGDEVVGKLVSQDSVNVTLHHPIVVIMQPVGPSQMSIAFAPFLASGDDEGNISLSSSAILMKPTKTRNDVANNYRKATGSIEIATPAASGLIL
jgi:small nuclear ribonucleoprotein (snRNP)-like protein